MTKFTMTQVAQVLSTGTEVDDCNKQLHYQYMSAYM